MMNKELSFHFPELNSLQIAHIRRMFAQERVEELELIQDIDFYDTLKLKVYLEDRIKEIGRG